MQVIYGKGKKMQKELNRAKNRSQGLLTTKRVMSCWLAWRWMTLWKNTSWWFPMVSHIVSHSMVPVTVPSIMVSCFNSNIIYHIIRRYCTYLTISYFILFQGSARFFKLYYTNLKNTSQSQISLQARHAIKGPLDSEHLSPLSSILLLSGTVADSSCWVGVAVQLHPFIMV